MRRALLLLAVALAAACAPVKPWQREDLARRSMTQGFGDRGLAGKYREKVIETKTGGGSVGSAPGGGCGCSQ